MFKTGAYIHIDIHTHIHTYTHTHIHTYTHTHIHTPGLPNDGTSTEKEGTKHEYVQDKKNP